SAATPQIAAAAALWLAKHWTTVQQYPEPWMRVEAARHALFTAAQKSTARMSSDEVHEKIGQGVMQAFDALAIQPVTAAELSGRKLPPAEASWSWLNLIFGQGGVSIAGQSGGATRQQMFALELTQMAHRCPEVEAAIRNPEGEPETISAAARNRYLEAALDC